MDQTDQTTTAPTGAPPPDQAPSGAPMAPAPTDAPPTAPAPTDAPLVGAEADDEPAVEATVPAAEPVDGAPTPLAAPAEGPVGSAVHQGSGHPRPLSAKLTPVLAAVAVAWVLRKLLTRNRA